MNLLTNDQTHRVTRLTKDGFISTAFIVHAAIQGPFKRKLKITMDDVMSYALGSAIGFAIIAVCFDIIVWRP